MKLMSQGKIAIAIPAFACATLLSFGWSEQRGVSLSVESAQARIGRPLTPMSVAGVARRQTRRAAYGYGGYGYGAGLVGAGVAAAAIGTAAVGTAGYYGNGYYGNAAYASNASVDGTYYGGGYYASSPWGDYECRNPYGYPCNPYSSKDWWGTGTTAGYVAAPYVGTRYYGGYYGRPLARAAAIRAAGY